MCGKTEARRAARRISADLPKFFYTVIDRVFERVQLMGSGLHGYRDLNLSTVVQASATLGRRTDPAGLPLCLYDARTNVFLNRS